nr:MAG TPA: hypothetical protein [Caudoviricetes sp.]
MTAVPERHWNAPFLASLRKTQHRLTLRKKVPLRTEFRNHARRG